MPALFASALSAGLLSMPALASAPETVAPKLIFHSMESCPAQATLMIPLDGAPATVRLNFGGGVAFKLEAPLVSSEQCVFLSYTTPGLPAVTVDVVDVCMGRPPSAKLEVALSGRTFACTLLPAPL